MSKQMIKQKKKIKSKYGLGGEMDNNPVQYPVLQSAASSMQNQASNSLGAPVETPAPQEEQPQSAFKKGGIKNKKSEIMKTMYKKAGKAPKKMRESFLEESKEIHFGDLPKGKKKFRMGGDPTDPPKPAETEPDPKKENATSEAPAKVMSVQEKYMASLTPEARAKIESKNLKKEYKKAVKGEKTDEEYAAELKEAEQGKKLKEAKGEKTFFEKNMEKKGLKYGHQEKMAEATGTYKGAATIQAGAELVDQSAELVKEIKTPRSANAPEEERMGGKRKRSYMNGGTNDEYTTKAQSYKSTYKTGDGKTLKKNSDGTYSYRAGGKKNKFQAMAAAGKARMGGKK